MKVIPSKPVMLILSGLQGSGKSTRAKAWVAEDPTNRERINWDEARLSMFGPDWKFNRPDEKKMKKTTYREALVWLTEGKSVVIDNTNLTQASRDKWAFIAETVGADIVYEEIDTDIYECIRRDAARANPVGRALIERNALFHGFIDHDAFRKIVIFDIDGTLADNTHRQHHVRAGGKRCPNCAETYAADTMAVVCVGCQGQRKGSFHLVDQKQKDWKSFNAEMAKDTLIEPIALLLGIFADLGWSIILVSGRGLEQGKVTEKWLADNNIYYEYLFMRNAGDSRSDVIVKEEILELLPIKKIKYVVDDRNSVVKMWRSHGLTVLQCAEGDF